MPRGPRFPSGGTDRAWCRTTPAPRRAPRGRLREPRRRGRRRPRSKKFGARRRRRGPGGRRRARPPDRRGQSPRCADERPRDPVRVAVGARRRHGLRDDGGGFFDSANDRQDVEHPAQTVDPSETGFGGEIRVGLDERINATGSEVGVGLDDSVPRVEAVVAGIVGQGHRDVGATCARFGVPGEEADGGGGVQARELRHIGRGGRGEDLFGPADRLEPLHAETEHGGVGGDRGRGHEVAVVGGPAEPGAQVGELGVDPIDRGA